MSLLTSSKFSQPSGKLFPNDISNGRPTDFWLKQFQCATIITYFFWLHLFLMIIFPACQSNLCSQPRMRGRGGSGRLGTLSWAALPPRGYAEELTHCYSERPVAAVKRRPFSTAPCWPKELKWLPQFTETKYIMKKKHDPVCFRWKSIGLKKGAPLSLSCNRHLGNAFLSTVIFSTMVTFDLQLELNWQKIIGKWIVTKVWIGPSGQNYNSIAKIKCIQNLLRLDSEARRCIVGIERRTRPMTTWWKPKFCKWENLRGIFLTVTIMRAHSKFFCC